MSAIIHRCKCGHPAQFHSPSGQCGINCPAHTVRLGPPELIPTFGLDGKVVRVGEPGHYLAGQVDGSTPSPFGRLCDCDRCKALFAEVTA